MSLTTYFVLVLVLSGLSALIAKKDIKDSIMVNIILQGILLTFMIWSRR